MNADNSTATTMTVGMSVASTPGGHIIVKDCTLIGATNWVAATARVRLTGAVPTSATSGVSVDGV